MGAARPRRGRERGPRPGARRRRRLERESSCPVRTAAAGNRRADGTALHRRASPPDPCAARRVVRTHHLRVCPDGAAGGAAHPGRIRHAAVCGRALRERPGGAIAGAFGQEPRGAGRSLHEAFPAGACRPPRAYTRVRRGRQGAARGPPRSWRGAIPTVSTAA